jgi:lysophospholipid acyltransferase (LPLAT)-like uncharacterized protein
MTRTLDDGRRSAEGQRTSARKNEKASLFRRSSRAVLLPSARILVRWVGRPLLRRWSKTWRLEVIGEHHLNGVETGGRGCFLALWHGRMLLGLGHHGAREWCVLVSGSQDGDISHALLERFGYRVIRGSTSRGGASAVREMLAALAGGSVLVITPDGPRGPRHSMNPGLAWMARATGYPIVPIGFACDRAWHARSWDRFTLPRMRARVVMVYGEPVRVEPTAGDVELAAATERVRQTLLRTERRGFEILQTEPDW